MKRLALEVVARTLDPAQISHLAEEFDHADNNNNGEVSRRHSTPAALFLVRVLFRVMMRMLWPTRWVGFHAQMNGFLGANGRRHTGSAIPRHR